MYRYLTALLLLLLLTACGSASRPGAVASVDGASISRAEYSQYRAYADQFYAWSGHPGSCSQACGRELLQRLIEEQIVATYAARHGIHLTEQDRSTVAAELARAGRSPGPRGTVLHLRASDDVILRRVLEREILVQHVEDRVTPPGLLRGPSVLVRVFHLPGTAGGWKEAVQLATSGGAPGPDATVATHWYALWRLPADERTALEAASPGQFAGPFHRGGLVVVYQLQRAAVHRYSASVRTQLEVQYFRTWLQIRLRASRIQCLEAGKPVSCAIWNDESGVKTG